MSATSRSRGAILLATFLLLLVLSGLALAAGMAAQNSLSAGQSQLLDKQALYLAEAGWQRSRQATVAGTWTAAAGAGNTYTETFGPGEYQATLVDNGDSTYTMTSNGYVPSQAVTRAKRQVVERQLSVTLANGTNHSLTAAASASSSDSTDVVANVKDGNTSTKWKAGVDGNAWIKMDFASAITLNKIVVKEHSNVTGVTVDWSDDNISWTTPTGLSVVESPSKTWTATFTATSHRYLRASISASSSKKPSVKELESYNSSVSSLGTGTVTSQW